MGGSKRNLLRQPTATSGQMRSAKAFSSQSTNNFDNKLEQALTKVTPVSKLTNLLEFDERTADGKEPHMQERGDINGAMNAKKGVMLRSAAGQTMKNGGKFSKGNQMNFGELFRAQRESQMKGIPFGMSEIGPQSEKRVEETEMSKLLKRADTLKKLAKKRSSMNVDMSPE